MRAPKFHPHPQSARGDFYVEEGMCLSCGVPHVVAPDLMGWTEGEGSHCIWRKQPETPKEIDQAIAVLDTQELGCHRYAGSNPAILERISAEHCDNPSHPHRATQPKPHLGDGAIRFTLLDERNGFLATVWTRLTGKKNK